MPFHNLARLRQFLAIFLLASALPSGLVADEFDFFEKQIRPIFVQHCYPCHSAEAKDLKGGLRLDSRAGWLAGGSSGSAVIVPGDADGSRVLRAVQSQDPDAQMPPPQKPRLTAKEVAALTEWINSGAVDPRTNVTPQPMGPATATNHWAFQPVTKPAPPRLKNSKRVQTPIDEFLLARLEAENLSFAAPADKRTWLRRVTFDLTGLPPTSEEVAAFLSDRSTQANEKVVDRLLASPRYGERWGRHWLDVARFADTKGYVYGGREDTRFIHSAAYRDWVIRAFNADMPYDRFLKLQLAADQMPDADVDSLAAMGYLTLGRRFLGVVHDIIDDRIDVVTRGMLGLTVSCARCHDHKFDPVPTRDYYSLYGIFSGSHERIVSLKIPVPSAKAFLDFESELKKREEKFQTIFATRRAEQSARLRGKVAEYLTAVLDVEKLHNEDFYAFVQADDINPVVVRAWNNYLFSTRKAFHPVWAPWHALAALPAVELAQRGPAAIAALKNDTTNINERVGKAFHDQFPTNMTGVAALYGKLFADVEKKWAEAPDKTKALDPAETEIRAILHAPESPASVPAGAIVDLEWYFDEPTRVELAGASMQIEKWILESAGAPAHAVILTDREAAPNPRVFLRGNPSTKGDEVPRQFLEVIAGPQRKPFSKGSGRLEFAEAIADRSNPLTARVLVNRLWLHHFGNGLVRTPSDFGTRAEPPTHPELLDWLAHTFMENGWSIKKMQRLICLSAAYQQSSQPAGRNAEPKITRVSTQAKEPAMVKAAAHRDPENRLLSHFNRRRLDFEALRDGLLFVSGELDERIGGKAEELFKAPFSKRRSVYGFIDRQFLPGALRTFDFASPDMHSPQRSETTVPQQALFFLNGPFAIEQARALALRVQGPPGAVPSAEEQVKRLYQRVYQRDPTALQLRASVQFLSETILPERAQAKPPSAWQYGFADWTASEQLKSFEPLPYFSGEAWQGGTKWPDANLGWAQLTAGGGHAGNDLAHAVVRRWVAPRSMMISISGMIQHSHPQGHGVRAGVFHRGRKVAQWNLHNQKLDGSIAKLEVAKGESVDFVVSIRESLSYNDFLWAPVIRDLPTAGSSMTAIEWSAQEDFSGTMLPERQPLTALEQLAQVHLLSNEFLFVD